MRMIDMEIRPNWREIVLAVPCPRCGAPVGEMCTSIGMATPLPRPDYHAERKNLAKSNYESGIHGGEQGQVGRTDDEAGSIGLWTSPGGSGDSGTPVHSPAPVRDEERPALSRDLGGDQKGVEG